MTSQIPDQMLYKDCLFKIIGVKGDRLFTPDDFDLKVGPWKSICWRGYIVTYSCINKHLYLTELHVGNIVPGHDWVSINDVQPETHYTRYWTSSSNEEGIQREDGKKYFNINLESHFSGGILMGADLISALLVNMGYAKPYQYEHVYELLFHEGTLTQETDHSGKAHEWRESLIRQHKEREDQIEQMRKVGLTEDEITDKLVDEQFSVRNIEQEIEWRFSLVGLSLLSY